MKASPDQSLDLRGVACPMNFVKAKLKLDSMLSGEELGIYLDEGEPYESVSLSLKEEGHEILLDNKLQDGYYLIVLRS